MVTTDKVTVAEFAPHTGKTTTDYIVDIWNHKENDMGVYIPNEDMPKDCYTCFCYETEFNMCSLTGKRLDDIRIRQDDCPLIEVVTCKDCRYNDGTDFCEFYYMSIFPTDFCSYGERRK